MTKPEQVVVLIPERAKKAVLPGKGSAAMVRRKQQALPRSVPGMGRSAYGFATITYFVAVPRAIGRKYTPSSVK